MAFKKLRKRLVRRFAEAKKNRVDSLDRQALAQQATLINRRIAGYGPPLDIKAFDAPVLRPFRRPDLLGRPDLEEKKGAIVLHPSGDPLLNTYRATRGKRWALDAPSNSAPMPPAPVLPGVWLYGGPLWGHFGHAVTENPARLWALQWLKEKLSDLSIKGILFCANDNTPQGQWADFPTFLVDTLSQVGVSPDMVTIVRAPLMPEILMVPEQAFGSGIPMAQAAKDFHQSVLPFPPDRNPVGAVYASRRHFLLKGVFLGEALIEEALSAAGCQIYYPEKHSLMDQLRLYNRTRTLICAEGSALHTLLYLPHFRGHVHMISRRYSRVFDAQFRAFDCSYQRSEIDFILGKLTSQGDVIGITDIARVLREIAEHTGLDVEIPSDQVIAFACRDQLIAYAEQIIQSPHFQTDRIPPFLERLNKCPFDTTRVRHILESRLHDQAGQDARVK